MSLPPTHTHSQRFDSALAIFVFILMLTVTNVWRVLNKQEMPHNAKQMGTNVIRGSALYFLRVASDHQGPWYGIRQRTFPLKGRNVLTFLYPVLTDHSTKAILWNDVPNVHAYSTGLEAYPPS